MPGRILDGPARPGRIRQDVGRNARGREPVHLVRERRGRRDKGDRHQGDRQGPFARLDARLRIRSTVNRINGPRLSSRLSTAAMAFRRHDAAINLERFLSASSFLLVLLLFLLLLFLLLVRPRRG